MIKFIESIVEAHSDEEKDLFTSLESALEVNMVFEDDLENLKNTKLF